MASDLFAQFVVLFFAGAGLLLAGAANFLLRRAPVWKLALATLLTCGVAGFGAWTCGGDLRAVARVAGLIALGAAAGLIAGSEWLASAGTAAVAAARRPAARWALLAVAGLGTVVGSVVVYETRYEAIVDAQMSELDMLTACPPAAAPAGVPAVTDRGTSVPLREATAPRPGDELRAIEDRILQDPVARGNVVRRQPADDRSNCHGWVFGDGRFWISGGTVDLILDENGYHPISDPRPGDVVVYRAGGAVAHTALVRYVTDGMPVLVEGKWGCTGVFLHPVDKSIYGGEFTYYRSSRPGHLLGGLTPPGSGPSALPPADAEAITE